MSTKTTGLGACPDVHELFRDLPSFTDPGEAQRRLGFSDGLYVFYEEGEASAHGPGGRVVRVGNHPRSDGTLWRRLRQHYSGRKNGSVFRKFLGGALLRRDDPDAPCLQPSPGQGHWERQDAKTCELCRSVEDLVSALLRERFAFRCIPVPDRTERNELEHRLIATLAGCPACTPSAGWLGHYAYSATVRRAGMWNSHGVGGAELTTADRRRLADLTATEVGT